MTSDEPAKPERSASIALALISAVVAVTCAAGTAEPPSSAPPAPVVAPAASVASSGAASSALPSGPSSAAPAAHAAATPPPGFVLPKLHAALAELEQGRRKRPVRVLWLGDSHTFADYLTHAVRRPLQRRFGNGGPGLLLLGLEKYRHGGTKLTTEGKWRREPASPASGSKQLDGVFGLGGMRVVPESIDARASVELLPDAVDTAAEWRVLYRAPGDGRLRLQIRGKPAVSADDKRGTPGPTGSPLRRFVLASDPRGVLDVAISGGAPQLFGVIVESARPGLVLDTLGINGARAATPLGWDAGAWDAELAERDPSLIVVAYGTNEAASTLKAERYAESLAQLVGRVRAAAPNADCLLIGPPDMAEPDGTTAPRVIEFDRTARAEAARLGCAFWSAFDAMGGEGSFSRWAQERPPLAAPDRVHLAPPGYERLGEQLARALLEAYGRARPAN